MKTFLFTVYDTAAAVYTRPFTCLSEAQAQREFQDVVSEEESSIGKHPEHYYLCRIGTWEDTTAKIETHAPETIITGLEAVALNAKRFQADPKQQAELLDFAVGGTD